MKKIKLYGIGNWNNFNYYIFDKKQEIIELLAKTFCEVFNLGLSLGDEYKDKNGRWYYRKISFEKMKDKHESIGLTSNKNKIDIFFGEKKIFVTIICSAKLRQKFNEKLEKISKMPRPHTKNSGTNPLR